MSEILAVDSNISHYRILKKLGLRSDLPIEDSNVLALINDSK